MQLPVSRFVYLYSSRSFASDSFFRTYMAVWRIKSYKAMTALYLGLLKCGFEVTMLRRSVIMGGDAQVRCITITMSRDGVSSSALVLVGTRTAVKFAIRGCYYTYSVRNSSHVCVMSTRDASFTAPNLKVRHIREYDPTRISLLSECFKTDVVHLEAHLALLKQDVCMYPISTIIP